MNNTNTTQLDEITYVIDKVSPNGDYTALSIRRGTKLFMFVGGEAEIIIDLLTLKDTEHTKSLELAKIEAKAQLINNMLDNDIESFCDDYGGAYSAIPRYTLVGYLDELYSAKNALTELTKQKDLLKKENK